MSGPYQGRDLSNCSVGRLSVAINCGALSAIGKSDVVTASVYSEKTCLKKLMLIMNISQELVGARN